MESNIEASETISFSCAEEKGEEKFWIFLGPLRRRQQNISKEVSGRAFIFIHLMMFIMTTFLFCDSVSRKLFLNQS